MSFALNFSNSIARVATFAAVLFALTGCKHSAAMGPLDGGASDDASTEADLGSIVDLGPFVEAPHAAFPHVATAGGPVLAHPALTFIAFQDYPYASDTDAFGRWIATSDWLTMVGADYGVHDGTYGGQVTVTPPVATNLDDQAVGAWLTSLVTAGTVPPPVLNETLYVIFATSNYTFTLSNGGSTGLQSCQGFDGYHNEVAINGINVPFAVLPLCANRRGDESLQELEMATSHEIIEAATDANPFTAPAYVDANQLDPWAIIGGEVGDLCDGHFLTIDGNVVQRVYSNSAAAAGQDPCIPEIPNHVFFGVSSNPSRTWALSPGQSKDFVLTGWSSARTRDWFIADMPFANSANAVGSLSTQTMNNGLTSTYTVSIPVTAQSGDYYAAIISSYMASGEQSQWPIAVYVQ